MNVFISGIGTDARPCETRHSASHRNIIIDLKRPVVAVAAAAADDT